MSEVVYHSYAKLNLYLDVLDRRPDGFHNIETLFQSVSLCDTLRFEPLDDCVEITASDPELDCGAENLITRAALALRVLADKPSGVRIHVDKEIPIAAGLAGGSGNAAATLVALNELWGLGLPHVELARIGLDLGSDVPFCLVGGTVAAAGRGEELMPVRPIGETWFVLLHPPLLISTASIFRHPVLTRGGPRGSDQYTPALEDVIRALGRNPFSDICFNAMESAAFADHPELAALKQRLGEAGCVAAMMSGSGPTMYGICTSREQAEQVTGQFADVDRTIVRGVNCGVERVG